MTSPRRHTNGPSRLSTCATCCGPTTLFSAASPPVSPPYGSFRRLNAHDIRHLGGWVAGPGPHLVAAQRAFDAARVLPATAAVHAFFQNFVQHLAVQGSTAPRGEGPRTAAVDVGSPAPRAGRTTGRDLHRPATRPRASARAPQSAPAAGPRPPGAPAPGSRCAAPSARPADAS